MANSEVYDQLYDYCRKGYFYSAADLMDRYPLDFDVCGYDALYTACSNGQLPAAIWVIDAVTKNGCSVNYTGIIREAARDGKFNRVDHDDLIDAMHLLIKSRNATVIKFLIDIGVVTDLQDLLAHVYKHGSLNNVEWLQREFKVKIDKNDDTWEYVLDYAYETEDWDLWGMLCGMGVRPSGDNRDAYEKYEKDKRRKHQEAMKRELDKTKQELVEAKNKIAELEATSMA